MGTTMQDGTARRTYQRRDRVAECLGTRLGILPTSAHQVLVGQLNYRTAEVILAHNDVHATERRDRWLTPIRAAQAGVAEEPLTRGLIIRAQEADALEDVRESAYLADPSPANRDAWLRALDHQSVCNLALRMALVRDRREHLA